MEVITGLYHKHLITLMGSLSDQRPRRRHRGRSYGPEADDALCVILETSDYVCAKRFTPNLVWWAE
jgi:hypothetical protein